MKESMVGRVFALFLFLLGMSLIVSGAYCAIAFSVALLQGRSIFGFPFDQMWIVVGLMGSWIGLKPLLEVVRDWDK